MLELDYVQESDQSYAGLWILVPHMPVIRKDKAASSVRPVFNA